MNQFLIDTHKKENIEYLKARDYYFDRARYANFFKNFIIRIPPVIMVVLYLLPLLQHILQKFWQITLTVPGLQWCVHWADYIVGTVSVLIFLMVCGLDQWISQNVEISNMLREEYDNRVYHIGRNDFAYDYSKISQYLKKGKKVSDYYKYEVWYGEVFCEDRYRNILCCQMDNVIYTYRVYEAALKHYQVRLGLILVGMLIMLVLSLKTGNPLLVFFSVIELIQMLVDQIHVSRDLISSNRRLTETMLNESLDHILADPQYYVRCLQDCVLSNRNNTLFISKKIRNQFLQDNSPYYQELNRFKENIFSKETTEMADNAHDMEVLSQDGETRTTLDVLHGRLKAMLQDIDRVFSEQGITYTLDGGTLIGAVRKNVSGLKAEPVIDTEHGDFLFWDDDIDIGIPADQIEKAKEVLQKALGRQYQIQDYQNEKFYSPRLSNFRVREPNSRSTVAEKDSPLWKKYERQGIFIDVYSYSPILFNLTADRLFRRMVMHPANRRIRKVELKWAKTEHPERVEEKFLKLKKRYLRLTEWYEKNAKNREYYCYSPNFINDLDKAGPYMGGTDLYGRKRTACFAEGRYPIPAEPAGVLRQVYGEKWYVSPFSSKEDLIERYGAAWYSNAPSRMSELKHLSYLNLKQQ